MDTYEIEIKAPCGDLDVVRNKLAGMGATLLLSGREEDAYYNHPARDFARTDEAVRVRTRGGRAVLTYKGPKLGALTKTRYEKETGVEDASALCEILEKLGFVPVEKIVKNREIFLLGEVEVCLDRVERAGSFVELEKRGTDIQAAERELFELASALGLELFERRSYLELVLGV